MFLFWVLGFIILLMLFPASLEMFDSDLAAIIHIVAIIVFFTGTCISGAIGLNLLILEENETISELNLSEMQLAYNNCTTNLMLQYYSEENAQVLCEQQFGYDLSVIQDINTPPEPENYTGNNWTQEYYAYMAVSRYIE